MNCFKRKWLYAIGAALAALLISGCASSDTRKAEAEAATAMSNARAAEARAAAEEAKAVQRLADKIDAGGASAYLIAKALRGLGAPAAQPVPVAQPQSLLGLAWQSVLQVADLALRGYGIKTTRDVAIAQSNNARDVAISTNAAFVGMGSSIERAGIAGYPYVQAPAANVTNTYTLSGTGVLGSGTYTGPVTTTTTTNCNGGTAAPGGNGGTTGAGGTGGGAPGGTC